MATRKKSLPGKEIFACALSEGVAHVCLELLIETELGLKKVRIGVLVVSDMHRELHWSCNLAWVCRTDGRASGRRSRARSTSRRARKMKRNLF